MFDFDLFFRLHEGSHTKPFGCPDCEKRFGRNWLMESHRRTHTGERPFACPECARRFADRSNMRAHMRRHHQERWWWCCCCCKAYDAYTEDDEDNRCFQWCHSTHTHTHTPTWVFNSSKGCVYLSKRLCLLNPNRNHYTVVLVTWVKDRRLWSRYDNRIVWSPIFQIICLQNYILIKLPIMTACT